MDTVWRLEQGVKLIWHRWDDEYLVFNEGSGATHLLDTSTAGLLQTLESSPQHFSELSTACCFRYPDVSSEEVEEWLGQSLRQFEKLGLAQVERAN
ncbi:MAG: HPr-rel-A system PqqD family peptide chaperone [Sedimenticola sp.]